MMTPCFTNSFGTPAFTPFNGFTGGWNPGFATGGFTGWFPGAAQPFGNSFNGQCWPGATAAFNPFYPTSSSNGCTNGWNTPGAWTNGFNTPFNSPFNGQFFNGQYTNQNATPFNGQNTGGFPGTTYPNFYNTNPASNAAWAWYQNTFCSNPAEFTGVTGYATYPGAAWTPNFSNFWNGYGTPNFTGNTWNTPWTNGFTGGFTGTQPYNCNTMPGSNGMFPFSAFGGTGNSGFNTPLAYFNQNSCPSYPGNWTASWTPGYSQNCFQPYGQNYWQNYWQNYGQNSNPGYAQNYWQNTAQGSPFTPASYGAYTPNYTPGFNPFFAHTYTQGYPTGGAWNNTPGTEAAHHSAPSNGTMNLKRDAA